MVMALTPEKLLFLSVRQASQSILCDENTVRPVHFSFLKIVAPTDLDGRDWAMVQ
jgi:hypothetical protein